MINEENDPNWTPPPPPDDGSMFSAGTREHYAKEIRNESTKAVVFGILSIFCCPPIFAYLAFNKAQEVITNIEIYEVEEGRRGMATAAKVLAIVGITLWVLSVIIRIAAASF